MPTLSNAKHEQFAQWIVAGKSQIEAYELSYGNRSAGANTNAGKLVRKPNVSARIDELRSIVAVHLPVLTLEKKRRFLLGAVETPVGQIDENHPLCQKVKRRTSPDGTETVEYEMVDKLGAMRLDAQLAGEIGADRNAGSQVMVNVLVQG